MYIFYVMICVCSVVTVTHSAGSVLLFAQMNEVIKIKPGVNQALVTVSIS